MPTTTIRPDEDVMTLVNVFHVDPARCDELVRLLVDATNDTMRHVPGFVSANIHRADDGTRVVNYAQWSSRGAFAAMQENAEAARHMGGAAKLVESFDPIVCTVVECVVATD